MDIPAKSQTILKDLGVEISKEESQALVSELETAVRIKAFLEDTEPTVPGLAKLMLKYFVQKKRDNGSEFYSLKEGRPDWMQNICRECHVGMLPDDYKYQFIHDALYLIIENNEEDDASDVQIEPDVYTADLLRWLASSISRTAYMDDASSEYGPFPQFENHLMAGQQLERQEVFASLRGGLRSLLKETLEE